MGVICVPPPSIGGKTARNRSSDEFNWHSRGRLDDAPGRHRGRLEEHGPYLPSYADGHQNERYTADVGAAIFMDLGAEVGEQEFRWIFLIHMHGAPDHN